MKNASLTAARGSLVLEEQGLIHSRMVCIQRRIVAASLLLSRLRAASHEIGVGSGFMQRYRLCQTQYQTAHCGAHLVYLSSIHGAQAVCGKVAKQTSASVHILLPPSHISAHGGVLIIEDTLLSGVRGT